MKANSGVRLAAAEIVAVVINIVPLALWYFDDLSAGATMFVFTIEAFAAVIFAILCVFLLSPGREPDGKSGYRRKSKLVANFSIFAFGMLGVLCIFVGLFLFLILRIELDLRTLSFALAIVLAFQLLEFFVDLITLRPLPLKRGEILLSKSMGKTAVLFFGVFFGVILAAFVDHWFVVPLFVLKTVVDVGEPIQFFLGNDKEIEPIRFTIKT